MMYSPMFEKEHKVLVTTDDILLTGKIRHYVKCGVTITYILPGMYSNVIFLSYPICYLQIYDV